MMDTQQIANLEARVLRIIGLTEQLQPENLALTDDLQTSKARNGELEIKIEKLRESQTEVEKIISRTLQKLDSLESAWAELQVQAKPQGRATDSRKNLSRSSERSESNPETQYSSEISSESL